MTGRPFFVMLVSLVMLTTGCRSVKRILVPGQREAPRISEEDIQQRLDAFYERFVGRVESMATRIELQSNDLEIKRQAIFLKMRLATACKAATSSRPAIAAYLNTWIFCVRFENYFETGPGRELAGTNQTLIVNAARELRREIEGIGSSFLPEKRMTELTQNVEAFARENPVMDQRQLELTTTPARGDPKFGWLLELPLSPFRAFQGVDKTAAALHAFGSEARAMNRTVGDIPRDLGWQSQILLLNIRAHVDDLLANLGQRQTNLNATLRQLQETIAAIQPIAASVENITGSIERSLTITSNIAARGEGPKSEPAAEKPPFKVEDYTRGLEAATPALLQLHMVLTDIERITSTNALPERLRLLWAGASATLDSTEKSARALVDHATVRVLQLMLVFFAGLFAWLFIRMRHSERLAKLRAAGRSNAPD